MTLDPVIMKVHVIPITTLSLPSSTTDATSGIPRDNVRSWHSCRWGMNELIDRRRLDGEDGRG